MFPRSLFAHGPPSCHVFIVPMAMKFSKRLALLHIIFDSASVRYCILSMFTRYNDIHLLVFGPTSPSRLYRLVMLILTMTINPKSDMYLQRRPILKHLPGIAL